jgi:hypothetical protein
MTPITQLFLYDVISLGKNNTDENILLAVSQLYDAITHGATIDEDIEIAEILIPIFIQWLKSEK